MGTPATKAPALVWESAHFTSVLDPGELYNYEGVLPTIHPLLALEDQNLMLRYDVSTGDTKVFVANSHQVADFGQYASLPATLPRLSEIIIITRASPWITTIRSPGGVTISDIFVGLYRDYCDVEVTQQEFDQLGVREQDQLHRRAGRSVSPHRPQGTPGYGALGLAQDPYVTPYMGYGAPQRYSPYGPPVPLDPYGATPGARGRSPREAPGSVMAFRTDWLLGRCMFNGLRRDEAYCKTRLGYNAPNVFVLELVR
ncbi:hypothetical protein AURDEDRAFT_183264 [Auricularia subglabra TFB-10046 SS5]|nr:hypothetical protein AURDEDRAFT_183264 [Auricularia subglabra TFB-10046 SS5]